MTRIRSIVTGTSLFAALALSVIGGSGINSTMAAPSNTSDGTGCIIAILKSGKAQEMNSIVASSDDDPSCVIHIRKQGGETPDYLTPRKAGGEQQDLHVRKAGGDQQEYLSVRKAGGDKNNY